jgi:TonB-linked SusC/RagA family outer membrane protein
MKKLTFLLLCLVIAGMQLLHAQGVVISGKTTDKATGEALPGVTVLVKGTTVGATSLADGTYRVTAPAGANTLVFSFIGYVTQEIAISGKTVIDVAMNEEALALQEVVVTGYSSERKKDIIGSVAVVKTDEMLSTPSGDITNQLQGKASGVTISSSGDPGKTGRVRVRGFGTFGESEPLYIIDGMPGDASRVNPNDVESIQVLKDAASAAVYGARAANGVIIVTTKKGKTGGVKVSLDSYYGISYVAKSEYPEVLNAKEWGDLYFKALAGAGYAPGNVNWTSLQYGNGAEPAIPEYILVNDNGVKYGGTALEVLRTSNPTLFASLTDPANYKLATHQIVKSGDTNWAEEMYNPAPIQNHQATISGGSDNNSYMLSFNYFDQTSTASEYSYYKRYSARANTTLTPFKGLRIGENIQINYEKATDVSTNDNAWIYHPLIPMYDIAGGMASSAAPGLTATGGTLGQNPVLGPKKRAINNNSLNNGVFGNAFAELDLFKGLTLRTSFGFDIGNRLYQNFYPIWYENAENQQPYPDVLTVGAANTYNWIYTNTANYTKTIGKSVIKVMVGMEAVNNLLKTITGDRYGYTPELQKYPEFVIIDAGTGKQINYGSVVRSTLLSQFARVDYTFNDKYIFNATVRRDGSSKFGKSNRYGVFPSAAIGWRVSSEEFMQNLTWISDMKLRASTGVIGNQTGLGVNNQFFLYTGNDFNNYSIGGTNNSVSPTFKLNNVGNPDAKWEQTNTSNIGLDMSMFDGSVTFSGEYYQRKTTDLLVQNQAPTTGTGATQPWVNVGSVRNRGVEFDLSKRGSLGPVEYEVGANFSKYKNMVLKVLDNDASSLTYGGATNAVAVSRTVKGQELAYFYGYKIDGFFSSAADVTQYTADGYSNTWLTPRVGGWRIKDVNDDKIINELDRTNIGSPHPDFQMNFTLTLKYKNFDLFTTVFWNQGGDLFNQIRQSVDFFSFQFNRSKRMLYESWTPELGDNAKLPSLNINDLQSSKYATDYFVEDATYVRLKTIQLGYTFPASLTNKLKIDNIRIYVQSQNLLTWAKEFTGMDPDAGFSGNSSSAIDALSNTRTTDLQMGVVGTGTPTPQQVLFGINVTF